MSLGTERALWIFGAVVEGSIDLTIAPLKWLIVPTQRNNAVVEYTITIGKLSASSNRLSAVDHPTASVVGEVCSAGFGAVEGVVRAFVVALPKEVPNKSPVIGFVGAVG